MFLCTYTSVNIKQYINYVCNKIILLIYMVLEYLAHIYIDTHGRPTLNLSSLTSVVTPNRVSFISSSHHNFSASTSKSKSNSWSISLCCYPFQCNTLPHSYFLLLSDYHLIMTIVTSTRICVQISWIPGGTPVALSPVAPSLHARCLLLLYRYVAPLLWCCPTQQCGFLTNCDNLTSSLMSGYLS